VFSSVGWHFLCVCWGVVLTQLQLEDVAAAELALELLSGADAAQRAVHHDRCHTRPSY
jgi:hypothetical protein